MEKHLGTTASYAAKVDISAGVSADTRWYPDSQIPLTYLKVYESFSEAEKLLINQAYALRFLKSSIVFENAVVAICRALPRRFQATLAQMVAEEEEHSDLCDDLIALSVHARFADRRAAIEKLMRPSPAVMWLARLTTLAPARFTTWLWITLFFEERFVALSRQLKATENVDPTHARAHHHHMLEEAGHVKKDEELIHAIWDRSSRLGRRINGAVFSFVFRRLALSGRVTWSFWKALVRLEPSLARHSQAVRAELRTLADNRDYLAMITNRASAPRFHRLAASNPEIGGFLSRLIARAGD